MRMRQEKRQLRGSPTRIRAFTFNELLVVIGTVALMLAMLFPSLGSAREQTRRMLCKNNLRQWGIALQFYRDDHDDYLPTEGTYRKPDKPYTWFNVLPPYLGLPPYREIEGVGEAIKEFDNIHVWICPSKNLTPKYKSNSGKNQFHYGMNQVLDGMGSKKSPSRDTPDFPDRGALPTRGTPFSKHPNTVFMFDIAPNKEAGSPRNVATMHQTAWIGGGRAKFHGDYANFLLLNGSVVNCSTDEIVKDRNFQYGDIVWRSSKLYWGYTPPPETDIEEQ